MAGQMFGVIIGGVTWVMVETAFRVRVGIAPGNVLEVMAETELVFTAGYKLGLIGEHVPWVTAGTTLGVLAGTELEVLTGSVIDELACFVLEAK